MFWWSGCSPDSTYKHVSRCRLKRGLDSPLTNEVGCSQHIFYFFCYLWKMDFSEPWQFPEDGHNICTLNRKSESICGKKSQEEEHPASYSIQASQEPSLLDYRHVPNAATNHTVISMGNIRIMLWKARRAWFCLKAHLFHGQISLNWKKPRCRLSPSTNSGAAIRMIDYDIKGHKIRGATTNVKSIVMMYRNDIWCQSIFLWRKVFFRSSTLLFRFIWLTFGMVAL